MENIQVTLPGGQSIQVRRGIRIDELMSPTDGDQRDVISAKVDGRLVDLSRALEKDCALEWISVDSPEGLDVLRHSTAHLMAQAVQSLFPGTQVTIGPTIENGFYYDFKRTDPFSQEELEKIEKRMAELAQAKLKITREEVARGEAIEMFRKMGEDYKVEIIEDIPEETVSLYRQGDWVDLCRGPHLPSTNAVRAFKLTGVAGAYWRGNEQNEMLQRIYGTAWHSKEALKEHLRLLEEAKKRDHRKLGQELGLFMISDAIGPGLPLWLPKGAMVRSILERYIVDIERSMGYQHVNTPQLARVDLYKRSGHWDHFKANMYPIMEFENKEELVLRPMNCPHHITIYKHGLHSYRDLPIRLAELGTMYRYERSGTLSGLSRVRAMTLNDAHIFCTPEQIQAEAVGVLRLIERVYKNFGFKDYWYRLSLRNPTDQVNFVANDAMWDTAEAHLRRALGEVGVAYKEAPGEAAYYGPKIDVQLNDVLGHSETLSTVQLDFYLPERFELEYVDKDGQYKRPVMIHRGVISTMERMMAFLIEHYAGNFPLWLAPVQVRILTVTDGHKEYAKKIFEQLRDQGWRVELDGRNEKLGYKIREAQIAKIPYAVVIGDKEVAAETLAPRRRGGENLPPAPLVDFIRRLESEVAQEMGAA
ncbi:MAG: threonine--tRNA ligase [Deltaproteobacteria bacterium]|nr:threonine--tRNA ligase [Deltaproteobacteria bacterium]MBI2534493.1 threonine--tRNA ligase [Deltaproteobacteria bacterium]